MSRFNTKLVMNEISQECKPIHTRIRTGNSVERRTKAVFPLAAMEGTEGTEGTEGMGLR